MRAVNLIPVDSRRASGLSSGAPIPTYLFLGALALALLFVTIYVLTTNTISDRKAKLTSLQTQVAEAQAQASRLGSYAQFAQLAQTRAETVREIASARFDWHTALSDLSRVVPANTSLQSLVGTVVPGATAGGSGATASSASSIRSAVTGPAFELTGCTGSQDDVARLMSRLRVVNDVTRVTLGNSQKSDTSQSGAAVSSSSTATVGCGANKPTFDLLVFFKPVTGAGPSGVSSLTGQPVSTSTTPGGSK